MTGYVLKLHLDEHSGKYQIQAKPEQVLEILKIHTRQGQKDVPFEQLRILEEDRHHVLPELKLIVRRFPTDYRLVVDPPREVWINRQTQGTLQFYKFSLNQSPYTRLGIYLRRDKVQTYPLIISNLFAPFHLSPLQKQKKKSRNFSVV